MSLSPEKQSTTDFTSLSSELPERSLAKESAAEKIIRILALLLILLFPVLLIICVRVVKQYKRAVIFRFGRVRKDSPAGPGIIWVIPCTDDVQMIDLRTQYFNLPPQEVLTKDSVTVTVEAVVYFHIERPLACLLNIQNNKYATQLITIATIRNILGGQSLYNLLTSRESLSFKCRTAIDKTTVRWGVVVERVEIKDVFLPYELQRAMAAEAECTRIAKGRLIEAEGEIKAAENLKEASKIIMEDPSVMLLRHLQTLNYIAADRQTTVMFPFPIDIPGVLAFTFIAESLNVTFSLLYTLSFILSGLHKTNYIMMSDSKTKLETSETFVLKKQESYIETDRKKRERELSVSRIYQGFNLDQTDIGTDFKFNYIEKCFVLLSYIFVIITLPLSLFVIFVVVRQFERAVILRNGKLRSTEPYGPGLVQYLPCVDIVKFTDLRIICYAVPPQEALTKDALTVAVDAVVYYKIYDPIWAVVNISDYKIATQFLAATTLRNALGTRKLSEILCDRPAVSSQVFRNMKNLTLNWGVKIVGFEVKDISLPSQLQRAMATEAESYRLANAKIIVAKAEIESTRSLQIATKLLMDNPYCMQLRYLQALQMIAGDKTHTVVMPFSADSLNKIFK